MIKPGSRVGVLMSGGVDSSVAALLLRDQGYDVIGITLQLWDYETAASRPRGERGCCDISHQMDARHVCAGIGISHVVLDLRDEFTRNVVQPYENAYLTGITPNPCVTCNSRLKWGAVLAKAAALEVNAIATGHYARVEHHPEGPILRKGLDPAKDQSYALWQVPREAIAKTLFPLGEWTKEKIRRRAVSAGLRNADKPDSQEVCFIPDRYDEYLRERYPDRTSTIGGGEIVDESGRVVGRHDGFFGFTIGQRRGLNISDGQGPYYVTGLDAEHNRVIVGSAEGLASEGLLATAVNWSSFDPPGEPTPCTVKVRYNDPEGTPATLLPVREDGRVEVHFHRPVRAVTPGQSAVWYRGDAVWGGGIISRAVRRIHREEMLAGQEAMR
ncbi:MAG: tRNA 2-thiouridine(34) synthase MnmA [bacterium]